MKKYINGELCECSAEEIAQREQDVIQAKQNKLFKEQEEANRIAKKKSAKAKLAALGLDEEEIKAIIGA